MSDLIDKQVVLDTIHLFFTEEIDKIPTKKTEDGEVLVIHKCQPLFEMNKAICKRIKALPSVSPTQNCIGNALDMRCDDAISRQAVLDVINLNWEYRRNCIRAIEKLPPVKQEPKWIPVSERLPETDNENSINSFNVLLWVKNKTHPEEEAQIYLGKLRHIDGDDGSGNFWGIKTEPCEWTIWGWCYFDEPEVIAWMPLPKPYEPQERSE